MPLFASSTWDSHPSPQILQEPQPHFDIIKRYYPHYIHRRARNGCPIWIELPTRINLPAIRSSGVSDEALQRHYVFVTEYLWGVVEPNFDTGQAITVLDVQGLGMRDFAGDALGFVKVRTPEMPRQMMKVLLRFADARKGLHELCNGERI